MSINKVILVGNLGSDPEMRTFQNGGMITTVNIATSERWTDKNTGERKEHTEWHRVVFSNRLAEIAGQYLKKGSKIYVEGSIRTRKWQDQTGQDRYSTEIRAAELQMLDSRSQGQNNGNGYGSPANAHGMVGSMNAGNNQSYNHLNNQVSTSYNKRPAQPQPMQQPMQQGPGPINYPSNAIGPQNPNATVIKPTMPPGALTDDDIPF